MKIPQYCVFKCSLLRTGELAEDLYTLKFFLINVFKKHCYFFPNMFVTSTFHNETRASKCARYVLSVFKLVRGGVENNNNKLIFNIKFKKAYFFSARTLHFIFIQYFHIHVWKLFSKCLVNCIIVWCQPQESWIN